MITARPAAPTRTTDAAPSAGGQPTESRLHRRRQHRRRVREQLVILAVLLVLLVVVVALLCLQWLDSSNVVTTLPGVTLSRGALT